MFPLCCPDVSEISVRMFPKYAINDMNKIKEYIAGNRPKTAVIVGTGFIGLEVCENLKKLGIEVTMAERLPQVTPGLDGIWQFMLKNI